MGNHYPGDVLRGDPAGNAVSGFGTRIESETAPLALVSGYCSVGRHGRCDGSRGGGNIWPCFCSCHLPGRPVEWRCAHRGIHQQSDDGRSHPVQVQTHPWSFSRARREWWQRRVD